MRRASVTGLTLAAALLLAGCAAGGRAAEPTWRPQPSFQGEGGGSHVVPAPQLPGPNGTGPALPGQPGASQPSQSGNGRDPGIVAKRLNAPVGLTVLPDDTALVGERTTGRVLLVQPQPGKPVKTVRVIGGLDTRGDGGLLDLAISPHYGQDSLIYAYVTTPVDNRVVTFTLKGPVTPVLTGIPKGRFGNGGRIAFGSDGRLYVATGDAGRPALAQNKRSLAGKVLRVSDIGRPPADNPTSQSPVFTTGLRAPAGLCPVLQDGLMVEVDGPGGDGRYGINALQAGADYGWPTPAPTSEGPIATMPTAQGSPGGCAVLNGVLYVTSMDGQALLASSLTSKDGSLSAGKFDTLLNRKYGRLRTVVADALGALWLTTSNRDGHGSPIADDERVIRIVPARSGGGSSVPLYAP